MSRKVNWRWSVPVAFVLAILEVVMGLEAYFTKTEWNGRIITEWEAVRVVCLFFVPAITALVAILMGILMSLLEWASGDRRR